MTDQTQGAENSGEPQASGQPSNAANLVDAKTAQPATTQQLTEVGKPMSGFEKSTLIWARLAVIMSAAAALFVCLQWYEMHNGGADTHELAVAAKDQARKMKDMSEAAEKIRLASEGIVTQEQRIADETKESLSAANRQNKAALEASNRNSRAALDATVAASRTSEKAYVTIGRPDGTVAEILWPKRFRAWPSLSRDLHKNPN